LDLGLSARYGTASAAPGGTDPEVWGGGINLGFGAFKIGGSFGEQDGTADNDGNSFDVGVSYANGPWSYSLTYFEGTNADDEAIAGVTGVTAGFDSEGNLVTPGVIGVGALPGAKETLKQIIAAATYKVNGNFKVSAFIADVDFDEDTSTANDIEGTVVGFGAKFSF
jgi:predicted porin